MKKYKIGYTCGVFDLFHVGHLNLLERCKEYCDILIVGVCDDKYVRDIKKKEPVYTEDQRTRILNALKVVDKAEIVTIEETEDKMIALKVQKDIELLKNSLQSLVLKLNIYHIRLALVQLK